MTRAVLPYRGTADLALIFQGEQGAPELEAWTLTLLVSRTPSAGILDVVLSQGTPGLDLRRRQLHAARITLPDGAVVTGQVSYVSPVVDSFVLVEDGA